MLTRLEIRDVVLIDRLDLDLGRGLSVLTGETGAGKSILLDALGLVLGARGEAGLVRKGADQAQVTAAFELDAGHALWAVLDEAGIAADPSEPLLLRRTVTAEGRSRASVAGRAAPIGLLRQIGGVLVEIQGQFDQHGLLNPDGHGALLDSYLNAPALAASVAATYRAWRTAEAAHATAAERLAAAIAEEDAIKELLADLDQLAPKPGEEAELSEKRQRLAQREKLLSGLQHALAALAGDRGAEAQMGDALRALGRLGTAAPPILTGIIDALETARAGLADAAANLEALLHDEAYGESLEAVDDRLHALRACARRHRTSADALPDLRAEARARLTALDGGGTEVEALRKQAAAARAAYLTAAGDLTRARQAAALQFDRAVEAELAPLKLDRARFVTRIEPQAETGWTAQGTDRIWFEVATNPGAAPGPLGKIASGGELSRFLLALKVVLAGIGSVPTLVFDEVDAGIGGAVAAAVGARLERLGRSLQVLVVTHSPQVAARGRAHLRVVKDGGAAVRTSVEILAPPAREEEIARMLSGATITPEARAQARQLLAGTA